MKTFQNTLVKALYKIKKSGKNLKYPISESRIKDIITKLLESHDMNCKSLPRVRATKLQKHGILENASTVVDMAIVHTQKDGTYSSPTKISLYFDSYLNDDEEPEHSISGIFRNKYKEALYRPKLVCCEEDINGYVSNILNELSHNQLL